MGNRRAHPSALPSDWQRYVCMSHDQVLTFIPPLSVSWGSDGEGCGTRLSFHHLPQTRGGTSHRASDPIGYLPGGTKCEETLPQKMAQDLRTGKL